MSMYKKKRVPVKIEPVNEARTIETKEGSQEIEPGQFLATGVRGEQYAFGREVFDTYEAIEGRPGFYTKREDVTVEAIQLAYPIKIQRPGWEHSGKTGDWFISRTAEDQYVCDAEIFAETYEPIAAASSANEAETEKG